MKNHDAMTTRVNADGMPICMEGTGVCAAGPEFVRALVCNRLVELVLDTYISEGVY